jgi:hypothetical protein
MAKRQQTDASIDLLVMMVRHFDNVVIERCKQKSTDKRSDDVSHGLSKCVEVNNWEVLVQSSLLAAGYANCVSIIEASTRGGTSPLKGSMARWVVSICFVYSTCLRIKDETVGSTLVCPRRLRWCGTKMLVEIIRQDAPIVHAGDYETHFRKSHHHKSNFCFPFSEIDHATASTKRYNG